MSLFGGEAVQLRKEGPQEPTLLAERSVMRPSLRQEVEMWDPFLPEVLSQTRPMRRCVHTLHPTLRTKKNCLRAQLLRSMPRTIPMQRSQSMPGKNVHHLRLPAPKASRQMPCIQDLPRQHNQNTRLQRRMPQAAAQCQASSSSEH